MGEKSCLSVENSILLMSCRESRRFCLARARAESRRLSVRRFKMRRSSTFSQARRLFGSRRIRAISRRHARLNFRDFIDRLWSDRLNLVYTRHDRQHPNVRRYPLGVWGGVRLSRSADAVPSALRQAGAALPVHVAGGSQEPAPAWSRPPPQGPHPRILGSSGVC